MHTYLLRATRRLSSWTPTCPRGERFSAVARTSTRKNRSRTLRKISAEIYVDVAIELRTAAGQLKEWVKSTTDKKANSGVTSSDIAMVAYYGTCHEARSAREDGDEQGAVGALVVLG
jgi:glucan phosphorylase